MLYPRLMADLLTTLELARWTGNEPAAVDADPFAAEVIDKVSQLACFLGGHDGTKLDPAGVAIPEWTLDPGDTLAPFDARMVVLAVAKRCYSNPDQVVQEGSVGPIGGDRVLDAAALLFSLTDSERATLTKYNTDGDPDGEEGELFTMRMQRGAETTVSTSPLYVGDDQQINLSLSADPREWKIPLFNPGDPGDNSLYGG